MARRKAETANKTKTAALDRADARLGGMAKETYALPAQVEDYLYELVSKWHAGSYPHLTQRSFISTVVELVAEEFKSVVTDNQVRVRIAKWPQKVQRVATKSSRN